MMKNEHFEYSNSLYRSRLFITEGNGSSPMIGAAIFSPSRDISSAYDIIAGATLARSRRVASRK